MAQAAAAAGFDRVIGFDMGGTSTDVSHYAGQYERCFETVGRRRAAARADDEHSHHRGRGRLDLPLRWRALSRRSGICGRRSGPRMLSPQWAAHRHRLQRDGGQAPAGVLPCLLRCRVAKSRWTARSWPRSSTALAAEVERATGKTLTPREIANGFLTIAVDNVANAIKQISIARGHDVTALCARLLRRRGWSARLPRRGCAWNEAGADSSACGCSFCVWHRVGGRAAARTAGHRGDAGSQRCSRRSRRRSASSSPKAAAVLISQGVPAGSDSDRSDACT